MTQPLLFTTSWDDGYALDLRLADMLAKHGIQGTFYPSPKKQHELAMMTTNNIRLLSEQFEIGAHTMSHPRLSAISERDAQEEISRSKAWVEDCTGKPCTMFCYPKGDCNPAVKTMVRTAGFNGARTVEILRFAFDDPFALPTTLQVYPFPWRPRWTRWWHPLDPLARLRVSWTRLRRIGIPLSACRHWRNLAEALLDYALRTSQPQFHLWGHSSEVERFGLWEELAAFLHHVASISGITHIPNRSLLDNLNERR